MSDAVVDWIVAGLDAEIEAILDRAGGDETVIDVGKKRAGQPVNVLVLRTGTKLGELLEQLCAEHGAVRLRFWRKGEI